eukprot:SAG31_NODE_68_length_28153_cov_23.647717_20_plen_204_part_00
MAGSPGGGRSPGRAVQKGGKTIYEKLRDDDVEGGLVDKARSFKGCPNDSVTWPEYDSSFWSRLFFFWFNPVIKLGARVPLEMTDLWLVHANESAAKNVPEFTKLWEKEQKRAALAGEKPGLARPVWQHSWGVVVPAGFLLLGGVMMQFLRPLLLMQILLIVEDAPAIVPREQGWMLAVAIAICAVADFLSFSHYNMCEWHNES